MVHQIPINSTYFCNIIELLMELGTMVENMTKTLKDFLNKEEASAVFTAISDRIDKAAKKSGIWETINNFLGEILNPTKDEVEVKDVSDSNKRNTATSDNLHGESIQTK